jgi:hypothetical protein
MRASLLERPKATTQPSRPADLWFESNGPDTIFWTFCRVEQVSWLGTIIGFDPV